MGRLSRFTQVLDRLTLLNAFIIRAGMAPQVLGNPVSQPIAQTRNNDMLPQYLGAQFGQEFSMNLPDPTTATFLVRQSTTEGFSIVSHNNFQCDKIPTCLFRQWSLDRRKVDWYYTYGACTLIANRGHQAAGLHSSWFQLYFKPWRTPVAIYCTNSTTLVGAVSLWPELRCTWGAARRNSVCKPTQFETGVTFKLVCKLDMDVWCLDSARSWMKDVTVSPSPQCRTSVCDARFKKSKYPNLFCSLCINSRDKSSQCRAAFDNHGSCFFLNKFIGKGCI
ncbi:hypothetical protein BCR37DRAFT_251734 [Protomyces lactucae-debilis]|uniref:Uncharacterized protein n=1 Tax=Protomyces lactucae-debilis TaxID=2754530 RepID=A0A1Y2FLD1_PROLT|nr:uncharacterized protein BCR37DRAFT_251734 [Protomyces lactucae-debilis]ORY84811.1 hypothetical protein BCR37DRAFT_251734 [Protomyces lactucae-debilis]